MASLPEIAVRRRGWRKSAYWPNLLARLAAVIAAAIVAATGASLLVYDELSVDTLGERGYQTMRLAVIGLGMLVAGALAGSLLVSRLAHRRANAAINALVADGGELPADETVCLYLRSFAASKSFALRRTWLSLGANVTIHDPETDIDQAVGDRCTLIAIGDRFDRRGALKISTTDERWIALFESLAERARLIFCFIGPTPSSRLEIAHIAGSPRLFEKTLFLVPPETDKRGFEAVRAAAADLGIVMPHHDARGFAFRPARGGRYMQIVPYPQMMKELQVIDLEAADLTRTIWRQSPYHGLDDAAGA